MTSSLVGSEMCIRDRAYAATRPPLLRGSTPTTLPARGSMLKEWPATRSCLLYTSDAADDM
eukprot:4332679-Prorocentrum_lima.AAC.1